MIKAKIMLSTSIFRCFNLVLDGFANFFSLKTFYWRQKMQKILDKIDQNPLAFKKVHGVLFCFCMV